MRQNLAIQDLAAVVVPIARVAGQAIFEIYARMDAKGDGPSDVLVAQKADDSPLTIADLAAHKIIFASLRELTPAIDVVSEEDADSLEQRRPDGQFWLIDPLDGTKEFLAGSGEFTVNIALVRDGVAVFGVVFAPVLDLLYWGGEGIGAFRSCAGVRVPIAVAPPVGSGGIHRVVASKSHMNAKTIDFIRALGSCELIQAGSSLKFCRVAEGAADVYPRLGPTCEWDTAAAQAVVEAAGGVVHCLQGEPLRYGKAAVLNPDFVAASQALVRPV